MSLKLRGQEVTLRISVNGVTQRGAMFKATNWSAKPRTDLKEDDYLGEQETDLDVQHNGWDLEFSVDNIDTTALDIIDQIIENERLHVAHPDITITAIYNFREPDARARAYIYHSVFMKGDEEGAGGRKDVHKTKFSAKAKERTPLTV